MIGKISKIINTNRLYSWMVVFIIFIQAYAVLIHAERPVLGKEKALARQEFKLQLEKKRQAIENLIKQNPKVAQNLGYLSLFMFIILITGCIFFADYAVKKKDNIETIPRTLDTVMPMWGLDDVLKVVILFAFFQYLFSLFAHLLDIVSPAATLDRWMDITISTSGMDLLVLMFILRFVTVKYGQDIRALGLSARYFLKNIAVAIYSYIGFIPIIAAIFFSIVAVAQLLNYTPPPHPIFELISEEKRPILLTIISVLASLVGPIIEEVFFRGFLYGALKKRYNIGRAIFISSFFFSFLHTSLLGFAPILALGAFLAYLREKTGSLLPPICVHIIHNTALVSLMFLVRQLPV